MGRSHGPAPRGRAPSARTPARAASGVSAATTAIGSPAYAGSAASSGARVVSERSLSGPIAARTPGRRPCCLEVERPDASMGNGRPEHGGVEHSREPYVDRVADAARGPRCPVEARRRLPDERELGIRRPALDVVGLVDEGPDVLVASFHLRLGTNEAASLVTGGAHDRGARSSDRRRSGRGCRPSLHGSARGSDAGSARGARSR